jgi:phosphate starvation-inducible protein PhoH
MSDRFDWIPPEMQDEYVHEEYTMTRKGIKKKNRKQRRQEALGRYPKNQNGNNPEQKKPALVLKTIKPKTVAQHQFFLAYENGQNVLAHGVAGTGKSFLAIYLDMRELDDPNSTKKRLIIIRTAVATREIGFMPGKEVEKIAVFEKPYKSIFTELYGRSDAYDILKKSGKVEFTTTSFMRGDTLRDAIVLYDEVQNGNWVESDTVITRLDNNSRIIVSGDYRQADLQFERDRAAVHKFLRILDRMPEFTRVEFQVADIVRSGLVKSYIEQRVALEDLDRKGKPQVLEG